MKLLAAALAAVLALVVAAPAIAETAQDRSRIAAIETSLRPARAPADAAPKSLTQRMAELNVPGVSIAFIEDGKVAWARAYGVADASDRRPATPETLFQAASMSKALAATTALRLVEQGRLDLDEDVNRRLKGWQVPESPLTAMEKVTLRRLLSHTAGLTVSGFPGYALGKPVPTTVQILNGEPPANTAPIRSFEAPGGAYAYSGGGFTVAQLLIEQAGGEPYPKLVERLVLKPAGMRRSTMAQPLPPKLIGASSAGHGVRGLVIEGGRHTYPEYAAAGLWTTPSDYGRFMIALQNSYAGKRPGLLRPATARTMLTPVDAGYALGEVVGTRGGRPTFEHSGGNAGFVCNSFAFLDGSRQGAVVMINGDAGGALLGEIFRAIAQVYGWGDPGPRPPGAARRAPDVPAAPK
jgi:CubicO group peptidase (beta-lactamase class C family)